MILKFNRNDKKIKMILNNNNKFKIKINKKFK